MIHKLVDERVRARPVVSIGTAPPDEEQRKRDASLIKESINESLGRQLEGMRAEVEQPAELNPERDFGALGTRADAMRHIGSRLLADFSSPLIPIFHTHFIVASPPYNDDWAIGSGISFGATADGGLFTVDTQGVSVAGVNVYLTSNADHDMAAAITPSGTFTWSWFSTENLPTLQTRGGLGTNVVHAGTEISRREVALWARSGATVLDGQSGEGDLAKAASMPTGPFVPIEIFPTYITMRPGEPYLFGLWCWQVAQYPNGAGWLGMMNAKMTSVWVSLSEPTIVA